MPDDNQTQNTPTPQEEAPAQETPISEPIPAQLTDLIPNDTAPVAPESPINAPTSTPVEDQNEGVNQPESKAENQVPEQINPVQSRPNSQSDFQQNTVDSQSGLIRTLLAKAQAKIQFNKQKKLDKIIQLAQKKQSITNDEVQKLLRISDASATRYLVKLVDQGRFVRIGSPRDAKYQFIH